MRYHTPKAAAALLDISVSSLRNYCATYKAFLSAAASPLPGIERRLSDHDVAMLQRVVELRRQGMDTNGIVATLQTEDTTTLQSPYIDAAIEPATPPEPPQAPPVATLPIELVQALQSLSDERYSALQRQIDAIGAAQSNRMVWFMFGFLAGLLLAIVGIVVVWLGLMAR